MTTQTRNRCIDGRIEAQTLWMLCNAHVAPQFTSIGRLLHRLRFFSRHCIFSTFDYGDDVFAASISMCLLMLEGVRVEGTRFISSVPASWFLDVTFDTDIGSQPHYPKRTVPDEAGA